jgi:hypothetical protein
VIVAIVDRYFTEFWSVSLAETRDKTRCTIGLIKKKKKLVISEITEVIKQTSLQVTAVEGDAE